MRKSNFPTTAQPNVGPGEIGAKIDLYAQIADWEFTSDPVKVEKRVKWFFQKCADYDQRPSVELLATALNTSRQTLWNWEQKGGRLGNAISQAKRMINALLTEWGSTGKMNAIYVIWLQKNNYGYQDNISIQVADRPGMLTANMSPDQIQAAIERDIPVDDDMTATILD